MAHPVDRMKSDLNIVSNKLDAVATKSCGSDWREQVEEMLAQALGSTAEITGRTEESLASELAIGQPEVAARLVKRSAQLQHNKV